MRTRDCWILTGLFLSVSACADYAVEVYIETTQATTMLTYRYWWSTTGFSEYGIVSPAS